MPELPEVETVRRGLEPAMEGARFAKVEVHRGDLRWPLAKDFARRLEGKTVTGLGRRAKYLLADLSSGDVLIMHLGMSGSFHVFQESARRGKTPGNYYHERAQHTAHDHIVFHMSSGAVVTFNDPRRFGFDEDRRARNSSMPSRCSAGSAPSRSATPSMPRRSRSPARARRRRLKAALSDQRVVAGLGNIYVCEALYRARLSPKRLAATIATQIRRPERARRAPGRGYQGGAQRGDQGRRLLAARSPAHRRRARDVPASLSRLRPRGREMSDARLPRHGQAHRAERTLDVLLSGVPEMIL